MKLFLLLHLFAAFTFAVVFGSIRGVVHDPDHRPAPGAKVTVKAAASEFSQTFTTGPDGAFEASLPVGAYQVTVEREGFLPSTQDVVVASGASPVLHFQLAIGAVR